MKISPLFDRVIVKKDPAPESSRGGILIPQSAQNAAKELHTGEVRAVGPGLNERGKRVEMSVQVGDRVIFGKYSGITTQVDGEEIFIISQAEIMAVLEPA